jgi:hypothetical protein
VVAAAWEGEGPPLTPLSQHVIAAQRRTTTMHPTSGSRYHPAGEHDRVRDRADDEVAH